MKNVLATRPGTFTQPFGFWLPDSELRSSPCWQSYLSHSSQHLFQPDPQRPWHYNQFSPDPRLAFSLALYNTKIGQKNIHEFNLPTDAVPVQSTLSGL